VSHEVSRLLPHQERRFQFRVSQQGDLEPGESELPLATMAG